MLRRSRERGGALVLAVITVVVLASLSAAFLSIATFQARTAARAAVAETALTVAESGVDYAIYRMNNWAVPDVNASDPPIDVSEVSIDVDGEPMQATSMTIPIGDPRIGARAIVFIIPPYEGVKGSYRIRAVGKYQDEERGVDVFVSPEVTTLFDAAAFADEKLVFGTNARVDSYNSEAGDYDGQVSGHGNEAHALTNGSLGSNGDILVDVNAKVWGNVAAAGEAELVGNASVSGAVADSNPGPAPEHKELPPIEIPLDVSAIPASAILVPTNDSRTILPGDHHFSSISTNSNSTLTIQGPARILVDDLDVASFSNITFDTEGGSVEIYGTGRFNIDSNANVSSMSERPTDVSIWITTDNYTGYENSPDGNPALPVNIDSNSALHATVYAPSAVINLNSHGSLYGAVIGKKITIDANFELHYDESILAGKASGAYAARFWRTFFPGRSL